MPKRTKRQTGGGSQRGRGAKKQKTAPAAAAVAASGMPSAMASAISPNEHNNTTQQIYRDHETGRIYYGTYSSSSQGQDQLDEDEDVNVTISVGDIVAVSLPVSVTVVHDNGDDDISSSSATLGIGLEEQQYDQQQQLSSGKKGKSSNKTTGRPKKIHSQHNSNMKTNTKNNGGNDYHDNLGKTKTKICEILAIYKDVLRISTRSTRSTRSATKQQKQTPNFGPLQLKLRLFEQADELNLDNFERVGADITNNSTSVDQKEGRDEKEEVYETDIILQNVLGKSVQGYASITSQTVASVLGSNKKGKENSLNKNGTNNNARVKKYCKTFVLLKSKNGKVYSSISPKSGKCHLDLDSKNSSSKLNAIIQQFQEKKLKLKNDGDATSSGNDGDDLFFRNREGSNQFYRFCRGVHCLLLSSDKNSNLNEGGSSSTNKDFIRKILTFVYQRIQEYDEYDVHKNAEPMEEQEQYDVDLDHDNDEEEIVDDSLKIVESDNCAANTNTNAARVPRSKASPLLRKSARKKKQENFLSSPSHSTATSTSTPSRKSNRIISSPSCASSPSRKCKGTPFHVDISDLKAFYTEINIDIPWESFQEPYNTNNDNNNAVSRRGRNYIDKADRDLAWRLRIGDTVAVHVDAKAHKNCEKYPFSVQWSPAEIICIYSKLEDQTEASELRKAITGGRRNTNRGRNKMKAYEDSEDRIYYAEIRWIFWKHEIPGIANRKSSRKDIMTNDVVEEIFETDDVCDIELSSLLGNVALYSDPKQIQERISVSPTSGVPVVNLFCHQMWSLHRKTLMPVGSMENRVQRGMMHSKYMGRDSAARASLGSVGMNHLSQQVIFKEKKHWKDAFYETIAKLTLAESSAVGNDSEHNIIGREKERKQIRRFLKSAIEAANEKETTDQMNSNMFVLFIGGAPGTGKTASVKSIVYHFNKEQAEGKIPSFEFVSVNGMEMRHPFDVYVRLWEAVSNQHSNRKEICPADKALANLEMYFARKRKGELSRRRVFVVLVDEIDYLVMKKQTVLYNLFDWPNRGFSEKSPGQLIVLGISNTLNLPERLHARLQSRIGRDRCMYASYSIEESMSILKGKLGITDTNMSIFHPDAIKFVARKISSESGDIRKVFHLCKAAAENVCNDFESGKRQLPQMGRSYQEVVNISDIQKASQKMFNSVIHQGVSDATDMEALLFVSLASLQKQWARSKGGFGLKDVVTKMEGVASSFGDRRYLPSPSCSELLRMLNRLGEARVISLHTPIGAIRAFNTMITLELNEHGVLNALKDTYHKKLSERFLSGSLF